MAKTKFGVIKVSDRNFKQAKPVRLTNKQVRKLKAVKKGDKYDPLEIFYSFVVNDLSEIDLGADRYMVTGTTYQMLEDSVTKWAKKQLSYLTGTALESAVKLHMLNYGPTDITHPDAEDNVVYVLKDLEGILSD